MFYEINIQIKNALLIPYKYFVQMYPYIISECRRNCRRNNESVTLESVKQRIYLVNMLPDIATCEN